MRRPALLAVPLLLALALTGCSGGDSGGGDDSASAASTGTAGRDSAGGAELAAPDTGAPQMSVGDQDSAAAPAPDQAPDQAPDSLARVTPTGSSLIRTASLGVRVDDVRAAADRAAALAAAAGGVVTSEQSSGDGRYRDASLLLRVPPDRFDAVVHDLAGLGEEQSRSLSTEDVTDQVVDLESRLASQRASVERVRALLDEADSLGEVVQIEGELTRRTADLEALEARLAALTDQVEMSSITLELFTSEAAVVTGEEEPGFVEGLRAGWSAFLTAARVLGATLGAVLPFLPLVLLGALVWRVRTRRNVTAPPAGTAPLT